MRTERILPTCPVYLFPNAIAVLSSVRRNLETSKNFGANPCADGPRIDGRRRARRGDDRERRECRNDAVSFEKLRVSRTDRSPIRDPRIKGANRRE